MLLDGQLHGRGNDLIDVADGLGAKPLGLVLRFQPIHPPFRQQLLVELLKIQRGQLRQWNVPNAWLNVVFNVALVGLVGGWPHLNLSIVFVPDVHPLADCISLSLCYI